MSNMTTEVGKRSLTVPLQWVSDDWQEASCYCIQLWYENAAENCEKSGGEWTKTKKKKLHPCMLSTGLVFRNEAAGLADIKPRRLKQLIKQLVTPHL